MPAPLSTMNRFTRFWLGTTVPNTLVTEAGRGVFAGMRKYGTRVLVFTSRIRIPRSRAFTLCCRIFASRGSDKFATIGWKRGRTGAPILNDVVGWIECEIERVDEAGDHFFVLGRVIDLDVEHEGGPLIFFRGGYGRYEV